MRPDGHRGEINMYVYILQSQKSGHYYIGSSRDPEVRCIEHNSGLTRSTKNKGPWHLKFKQYFTNSRTARHIERKLKNFKSRKIIEKIISDKNIRIAYGV